MGTPNVLPLHPKCPRCEKTDTLRFIKDDLRAMLGRGAAIQFQCVYCDYMWEASQVERDNIAREANQPPDEA